MKTQFLTNNRVVPAVIWGWTAAEVSIITALPFLILVAVPLAILAGATVARPATRYAIAVAIGLMAGSTATLAVSVIAIPLALPVYVIVTALVTRIALLASDPGLSA